MDLIQKLKQKRKEIALKEGKELFMILSNATIDEMVHKLPQTKEDLILIKGWGEKKIQRYGDEFLKILKNDVSYQEETLEAFALEKNSDQPSLFQTKRISLATPTISQEHQNDLPGALSVSEFLGQVNITLSTLGLVKIKGEIADVGVRNGYAFFELKDSIGGFQSEASLGCFVGWRCFDQVKHLLENGMEVIISGYPKIYLKNGSFRLEVTDIEPVGEGALQKAFEALKLKLEQKGYFDTGRKRTIPAFIRKIGLITSMSGAAIVDFQKNLGDCGFSIDCVDVRVEGDQAEESIIQAIRLFNEQKTDFDALVIIRGGGSLQSLKAFNSEKIADAIYYSRIPIITGIGHERDETIAGFTSDLNCSTPTAVANFLHSQFALLQRSLQISTSDLVRALNGTFEQREQEIVYRSDYLISACKNILYKKKVQVESSQEKLAYGLQKIFFGFRNLEKIFLQSAMKTQTKISEKKYQVQMKAQKILHIFSQKIQLSKEQMTLVSEKIKCLNPEAVLERGYSIAYDKYGQVIRKKKQLQVGDELSVRLSDGTISTQIKKISAN